jgi:hypothetical protein
MTARASACPLPLAAGELRRPLARLLGQPDPGQELAQVVPALGLPSGDGERQQDVLRKRQVVQELRVLVHHADPPPRQRHRVAVHPPRVAPPKEHLALARRKLAVAEPQERGLARPRRPGEEMERAGRQRHRQPWKSVRPP